MPKVRKNRRHLFNRRKNDTRKNNTVRDKENTPPALLSTSCVLLTQAEQPNQSLLQKSHPNSTLSCLYDQIKESDLTNWSAVSSDSSIQLFTV